MPKIEVTFDIDANGILNVTAKDQATSKEQKITITGSSGLSDSEVERMVQEAEEHAEEDRKRREAISLRNDAESMVFQAEKTLTEYGDQIPVEIKTELDEKVAGGQGDSRARIARMSIASSRPTRRWCRPCPRSARRCTGRPAKPAPNGAGFDGAGEEPAAEDDSTVEGEFREVGSER